MFDWSNLITLAERWLNQSYSDIEEEFVFRSVINRAYYGSHGFASLNLEFKGVTLPKDRSVHDFVIKEYKKSSDPNTRKVGLLLAPMLRHRNDADYEVEGQTNRESYSKGLCEKVISDAKTICKQVKKSVI